MAYLGTGAPAPWFHVQALDGNPNYAFETVGGRYVLMLFFGAAEPARIHAALQSVADVRSTFDDVDACFFGIVRSSDSLEQHKLRQHLPGIRFLLDYDGAIHRQYAGSESPDTPAWLLLDPTMRVVANAPLDAGKKIIALLLNMLRTAQPALNAPILIVPRVFPRPLCRRLIDYYSNTEPFESGFMRDVGGETRMIIDHAHKRRTDCTIDDADLRSEIAYWLTRSLLPQIHRGFQFTATRIERWIVACYDAEKQDHFRPHRDNTTKGTAHRRFACTMNLNAEEYEGGELRFPEYGQRTYRAPTGGAVVFSCSLLHEATPVVKGRRYAFLPFFYDDSASLVREENKQFLADNVRGVGRSAKEHADSDEESLSVSA